MTPFLVALTLASLGFTPASPNVAPSVARTQCDYARALGLNRWTGRWVGYKANKLSARERITVGTDCVLVEEFEALDGTAGRGLIKLGADGKLGQPYAVTKPEPQSFGAGTLVQYDDYHFTFLRTGAGRSSRITWELIGPNAGRQLLENSTDGGRTWTVAFDLFLFRETGAVRRTR